MDAAEQGSRLNMKTRSLRTHPLTNDVRLACQRREGGSSRSDAVQNSKRSQL